MNFSMRMLGKAFRVKPYTVEEMSDEKLVKACRKNLSFMTNEKTGDLIDVATLTPQQKKQLMTKEIVRLLITLDKRDLEYS